MAPFSTAVPIQANTTYIASYFVSDGRYAVERQGLANAISNAPLTALAGNTSGGNGVYEYSPSGGLFPAYSYQNTNYFVDVEFSAAGDTQTPSVPANLQATAISTSQINLTWNASSDNVAVTGYRIYRGGSLLTQVASTSYSNTGLAANTSYSYQVSAVDAAGNESAKSATVTAVTWNGSTLLDIGETRILGIHDEGNANLLVAQSASLNRVGTVQSISFYVTQASGQLRLGVYDASGPGGAPGIKKQRRPHSLPSWVGIKSMLSLQCRFQPVLIGSPIWPAVIVCISFVLKTVLRLHDITLIVLPQCQVSFQRLQYRRRLIFHYSRRSV